MKSSFNQLIRILREFWFIGEKRALESLNISFALVVILQTIHAFNIHKLHSIRACENDLWADIEEVFILCYLFYRTQVRS